VLEGQPVSVKSLAFERNRAEFVGPVHIPSLPHQRVTAQTRLNADLMFEDVFKEMPEHLQKQRALMRAERK
jgi:hypothetical protein